MCSRQMTRRKKNPLRNRIYSKFLELTSQEMYSRQLWELTLRYEGERITLVITTCTQFIFIHFGERTALHSFKELQDMYVFFIILKAFMIQTQNKLSCRRHWKKKRAEGSLERNWQQWNKSMCKSVKTVT